MKLLVSVSEVSALQCVLMAIPTLSSMLYVPVIPMCASAAFHVENRLYFLMNSSLYYCLKRNLKSATVLHELMERIVVNSGAALRSKACHIVAHLKTVHSLSFKIKEFGTIEKTSKLWRHSTQPNIWSSKQASVKLRTLKHFTLHRNKYTAGLISQMEVGSARQ